MIVSLLFTLSMVIQHSVHPHTKFVSVFTICIFLCLQEGSPFIVNMTYAFQTPEKLCFILDLMNGGDLHYHLSQHGVFNEREVRFYASEVILGLEHMHNRFVVYRDLKVRDVTSTSLMISPSLNKKYLY